MVHSIAPVFENLNASNWYKAFLSACCAWVGSRSLQQCSVSCVTCISTVMPAKLLLIHYFFFFLSQSFYFILFMFRCAGSSLLHRGLHYCTGFFLFFAAIGGYSLVAM